MNNVVNKENLSAILDTYADMVMRIAYQNVRNMAEAEDICQDVFLKLIERERSFESEEHIKAYIIRITINRCRDYLKSGWFRKRVHMNETVIMEYSAGNSGTVRQNTSDYREEENILEKVLELPVNYKNVIYLYYYEGYSVKEISALLHKKEGTVKTWLARARQQLKDIL